MIVLDASALLAYLFRGAGHIIVEKYLESACISTVNTAKLPDDLPVTAWMPACLVRFNSRLIVAGGTPKSPAISFWFFPACVISQSGIFVPGLAAYVGRIEKSLGLYQLAFFKSDIYRLHL